MRHQASICARICDDKQDGICEFVNLISFGGLP
jgi:hypothetical protein